MTVRYPDEQARRNRLLAELDRILPLLVDEDTELVVLFGSLAGGRLRSTSDLDILVVRTDNRRPAQRMDELYRRLEPRVALDLIVYTPEELEEARVNSSFIRHALENGKILYDRSKAVEGARKKH
ncbi:MAG: nucleotidyltransferase domain-containing protein [Candidatus Dadabacteria bacterium]|nr:MAG: nucleotidyltransferase domain-containing protein [Candidatus Dadabacteria bacterium]